MTSRTKRLVLVAGSALVVWYLAVVFTWALRPLSDTIPIGTDRSPTLLDPAKPERQYAQEVSCHTLFSSSARDTTTPLPALPTQPEKVPPLTYPREACTGVQRDARIVFGLGTGVLIAGLAVIALLARRFGRDPGLEPVSALPT